MFQGMGVPGGGGVSVPGGTGGWVSRGMGVPDTKVKIDYLRKLTHFPYKKK